MSRPASTTGIAFLLSAVVLLAACATGTPDEMNTRSSKDNGSEQPAVKEPQVASRNLDARLEARERVQRKLPEPVPVQKSTAVRGEVPPELVSQVRADLATRIGVASAELALVTAEAVLWPDGSLGCPQPDETYTDSPVPGYRIVLGHGGESYDYRVHENGYFFLCGGLSLSPLRRP